MQAYLDGKEPDVATLKKLIRKGTISFNFVPVTCGAAFKNKGVQTLLDAVVDYLPSPLDVPPVKGIKPGKVEETSSARPTTTRRCRCSPSRSWTIRSSARSRSAASIPASSKAASTLINSTRDRKERVGRMLLMHANSREDVKEAYHGDIVALAALKETRTGDTLCDPQNQVILEKMEFPEPVIEVAIEPKTKADQEKMGVALARLAQEDPSFRVSRRSRVRSDDPEGHGRTPSRHQGRHPSPHLQGRRQYRRAAGRLSRDADQEGRDRLHAQKADRRFGPVRARARSSSSRCPRASGFEFENDIVGGSVPKEYIPGVEKGLNASRDNGVLAGFPLIDFKATLVDGAYHEVNSNVLTFEIAARAAFRELKERKAVKLLEPIMKVEVVTPDDFIGGVIGDLNSRRGQVQGTDQRGNAQVITAMVPLANMFGYVNNLRSMSQGRASYSMQFDHYEDVPRAIADEVIAKFA